MSTSDLTYDTSTSSPWQDTQRAPSEREELLLTVMPLEQLIARALGIFL